MKNGSDSKSERGPWHEVGNDTLVSFAFVYLSELFFVVYLYTYSVFEDILDVLSLVDQ
jgi:hypothetical protein